MDLPYVLVDVFTDRPLTGNQLAVFTAAQALTTEQMQALARETGLSETTFLVGTGAHGPRVRIFTPEVELPFAGHPTLGTAVTLLALEGRRDGTIALELAGGMVPVEVVRTAYGARAELVAPPATLTPWRIDVTKLCADLGLETRDLDAALPPAIGSCGNAFGLVAVRDAATVSRVQVGLASREPGSPLGIVVYALDGLAAHARVLIPGSVVPEDAATGSANAPLVAYLHTRGRVREGEVLVTTQGVEMGRPSRLEARLLRDADGVLRPAVAGGVVTVARGVFVL